MPEPSNNLILESLSLPVNAIACSVNDRLAALYPASACVYGSDGSFDFEAYAREELCRLSLRPAPVPLIETEWQGIGDGLRQRVVSAWADIGWQGHTFQVLSLTWQLGDCRERHYWILSPRREHAEEFLATVCEWNDEVRGEVLVFAGGYWQKNERLFKEIQTATFDNLVLPGGLKEEIRVDFDRFFFSRAAYDRYRVPWKRGVLFIGPPGNGKTHTVKALVNYLARPCLYVKSFKSRYGSEHDSIRAVFARARQTTPCLLILEDLESLLDKGNRSYFLNELDGFASNTGIVVLATTNHPEKLDPAILERPSRFDRKYHFELPGAAERLAYIQLWNDTLESELRLSGTALHEIADSTDGFSFAYLKELFLSSLMRWIGAPGAAPMEQIMAAQRSTLRSQMSTVEETPSLLADEDDED